jgi:drug/metabolite transporter (DMT)-like permease
MNTNPAVFVAFLMAFIDVLTLPLIKKIYVENWGKWWLALPILIYAVQPIIFYYSMRYTTMTSMNMMWDLASDILVTLVGIFILHETLGISAKLGVIFGFVALYFFSQEKSNHRSSS